MSQVTCYIHFELLRKELIQQSTIHSDEISYQVIQSAKAKTYY